MLGPEGAGDAVVTWLAARLPARLRILETRYELEGVDVLPDPVLVAAQDRGPMAIEDWPAVLALPQGTISTRLVEVLDDGAEVYRVRYRLRIYAWVRSEGYAATDTLRKRYTLAIREALLERKQLVAAPAYGVAATGSAFAVAPETIREDYSDVMTDTAGRTIAAAFIEVAVDVDEVLEGPAPFGTVETTQVDTAALPPHPAL